VRLLLHVAFLLSRAPVAAHGQLQQLPAQLPRACQLFGVLLARPGAALEGFSGEAPQKSDKLQDFTVGLKI